MRNRMTGLIVSVAACGALLLVASQALVNSQIEKAGQGLIETVKSGGLWVIAAGALITTFVAVAVILIGYKAFKLPLSAVTGILAGIQTQPACLAYANQQAENELPNVWYATVYPASMVANSLRPDPRLGAHPALIMLHLLQTAAIVVFIYMVGLFLLAQVLKNYSIVDIGWGLGFIVVLAACSSQSGPFPGEGPPFGPHRCLGPPARAPHLPPELGQAGGLPLRADAEAMGTPAHGS